ncbi:MAG: caspase family protein [Bacteroidia bacterium]
MSDINRWKTVLKIETGGHTGSIAELLLTSDGQKIVTSSEDKTIREWDVKTLKETRKILGQVGPGVSGEIKSMALTPDDKYLAVSVYTGDNDQWGHIPYPPASVVVRIYDFEAGKLEKVLVSGHTNAIYGMAFSEDSKYLATGAEDHSVRIWDFAQVLSVSDPQPEHIISNNNIQRPNAVRFIKTADDYQVVYADYSEYIKSISLYSLRQQKVLATYRDEDRLLYIAVSQDYIAACGYARHILIFDKNLNFKKTIDTEGGPADLDFSPDGKLLIAGGKITTDNDPVRVNVYEAGNDFRLVYSFEKHDADTQAVVFQDNETAITCGGNHKEIMIWKARTGEVLGTIKPKGSTIFSVGISGKKIAFGKTQAFKKDQNNYAPLEAYFDMETFEVKQITSGEKDSFKRANISRDGKFLFVDPNDQWDLFLKKDGYDYRMWRTGGWYYHEAFGFSDEGMILTGGRGGEVRAYNENGDTVTYFIGHADRVWDIASENNWLVTGGVEQVIKIWNLDGLKQDQEEIQPMLNLFVSDEGEWVIWSNSGYYNSSLHGDKHIGYIVNQGETEEALWFNSDRFIKTLYRPDIIKLILETGSEEEALKKATHESNNKVEEILPPKIELLLRNQIDTTEQTFDLEFEVKAKTDPVSRFWILKNDDFLLEKKAEDGEIKPYQCVEVVLSPGENRFTILAESLLSKSNPAEITFNVDASDWKSRGFDFEEDEPEAEEIKPNLYILTIGVSNYKNSDKEKITNLDFAHEDAMKVAAAFETQKGKVYGEIITKVLTNEKATRQDILDAIKWLGEQVRKNDADKKANNKSSKDVALIFFAGHGLKKDSKFYFLSHDTTLKNLAESAVSLLDIGKEITTFPSELIIMTDACHAGRISADSMELIESGELSKRLTSLNERAQVILNATSADKPAFELRKFGHGAFTKVLLDGLQNFDEVDVLKLTSFVQRNVKETTKVYPKGPQEPNITIFGSLSLFNLYRK